MAQLPRERRHPERPALRAAVARGHGVGDHRRGPLDAAAERLQSRRVERVEQDDAAVPPEQARRALDVVAAVLARAQHLEPGDPWFVLVEALPQLPTSSSSYLASPVHDAPGGRRRQGWRASRSRCNCARSGAASSESSAVRSIAFLFWLAI